MVVRMRSLADLVARVEADLADGDRMSAEHGVDTSEWVEVRRTDVEALLEATRRHAGCHPGWVNLGPNGFARLREQLGGGDSRG